MSSQATCDEGVGWYVLVLTLSALLCCCCFLTMARKFVAVWHERQWTAVAGELTRPLLDDDDGEEQAHEVCTYTLTIQVYSVGSNGASLRALVRCILTTLDFDNHGRVVIKGGAVGNGSPQR